MYADNHSIIRFLSLHGITEVTGVMLQVFGTQISLWQKGKYPLISWAPVNPLRLRAREVSWRGPDYFPTLFVLKLWDGEINLIWEVGFQIFQVFPRRSAYRNGTCYIRFAFERQGARENDELTTNYMIDNKLQILFTSCSEKEGFRFLQWLRLWTVCLYVCMCHRSSTLKGSSTNMTKKIITLQNE